MIFIDMLAPDWRLTSWPVLVTTPLSISFGRTGFPSPIVNMKKCRVAAVCILLLAGCVAIHYKIQRRTESDPHAIQHTGAQSRELHNTVATSQTNASLEQLLSCAMFNAQRDKLQWISDRITRMSHSWTKAYAAVRASGPALFASPKKILLLPGLLSEYSSYDFAANAYKGGYLGELVQWSDLIAALHMLHHKITIITSMKQLTELVPPTKDLMFDLVVTDYIGLAELHMADLFAPYKCHIRVLDSFGSEPFEVFRTLNFSQKDLDNFNMWNFEHMRQFWTYFPHTPDNTFLGTVVEEREIVHRARRSNKGLLYGKEGQYISGREEYVNVIGEYMELHSTFKDSFPSTPKHVINDGVMTQENVQKFLQSARLFIGLGFPYDGPGPLEALANGCPFIQPKFNPPYSGKNNAFFRGKPTSRSLSSQHPYLEQFVGEPYVYTVDATDPSAVRKAVMAVLKKGDLPPLIPYELTAEGFMERVGSLVLHQDFCDGKNIALHGHATASSSHADHSPQEAVDGLLGHTSCWWSHPSQSSWWSVDLKRDVPIRKIRVYFAPDVHRAQAWTSAQLAPFQISLLNSNGREVAKKTFRDARAVYVWDDVYVLAGSVRIESLYYPNPAYMVLCGVEVYKGVEELPVWPALYHLKTKASEPGVSCKDTCALQTMICEPAYFKFINTEKTIRASFKCKSVAMATHYNNHTPGVTGGSGEDAGVCLLNSEPMLLSCAGYHDNFVRLCPCRPYAANQVALPPSN